MTSKSDKSQKKLIRYQYQCTLEALYQKLKALSYNQSFVL